ncbi:MAG: hypothetical protein MOB07_15475 [Acidobacteria bacterium]|nr:hypothetical protein [Acidobacteriota bacterium]
MRVKQYRARKQAAALSISRLLTRAVPHRSYETTGLGYSMRAQPDCQMSVLCGHTHGAGEARILPNLNVITGGAEYGSPGLQELLIVQ